MEKSISRIYEPQEMDTMNYILGKANDNKVFTKFELETMNKIDLFDKKMVNMLKIIFDNKNNIEKLKHFQEITKERRCFNVHK